MYLYADSDIYKTCIYAYGHFTRAHLKVTHCSSSAGVSARELARCSQLVRVMVRCSECNKKEAKVQGKDGRQARGKKRAIPWGSLGVKSMAEIPAAGLEPKAKSGGLETDELLRKAATSVAEEKRKSRRQNDRERM